MATTDDICEEVLRRLAQEEKRRRKKDTTPVTTIKSLIIRRVIRYMDQVLNDDDDDDEVDDDDSVMQDDDDSVRIPLKPATRRKKEQDLPLPLFHAVNPRHQRGVLAVVAILAGLILCLVSLTTSWFVFIFDPLAAVVQMYMAPFGILICLLEGSASTFPWSVEMLAFLETWVKLLMRPYGKNFFYLFVGVLGLSLYRVSFIEAACGFALTCVGASRFLPSS